MVDFVAGISPAPTQARRARLVESMGAVEEHEDALRARVEEALTALPRVRSWSRAKDRTPTILVTIEGRAPAECHRELASAGLNAPAGSSYAIEPSRWLGLGEQGGLRIGFAPYTNGDDVERLLVGLEKLAG